MALLIRAIIILVAISGILKHSKIMFFVRSTSTNFRVVKISVVVPWLLKYR